MNTWTLPCGLQVVPHALALLFPSHKTAKTTAGVAKSILGSKALRQKGSPLAALPESLANQLASLGDEGKPRGVLGIASDHVVFRPSRFLDRYALFELIRPMGTQISSQASQRVATGRLPARMTWPPQPWPLLPLP
jgi:hypothetical protein